MDVNKTLITLIRSLKNKEDRKANNLFVAEGDKLISELITTPLHIQTIYKTAQSNIANHENTLEISPADMTRLSHLKTPSASLALVRIPVVEPSATKGLTLVLDGVQDPGNIGTIIRVADWFGIHKIICSPECADCFAPKTVQATMGAIARVEILYTNLPDYLSGVGGRRVYGTFLTNSENIYSIGVPADEAFLVMGSEGRGISPEVERLVTDRLYIPPFPASATTVESLNVAVATAIAVSEFRRSSSCGGGFGGCGGAPTGAQPPEA